MNLLMLSGDNSVARGRGGAFADLLRRFSRHWSRIDILTPNAPDATERVLYDNVFVHPAPYHRALQPLFIRRKGAELLAQREYALVVSHDFGFFYNGIGALWLLRGRNIPLVSEIHHVEGYPIATTLREKAWRAVAMRYLPLAAKRVAAFRAVNQREVPELLRKLGIPAAKILVLPSLYMDFDIYRPLPDVPKLYDMLFVGRLAANKGIGLIVDALATVQKQHPDVKLAIRGEGELRAELQQHIAALGLEKNVIWLERVADAAAMARLYQNARMLICASTVEGNPRVTIEAMACGVPVLSTPVGIMPEVIVDGENGFLFPHDAGILAERIINLLEDQELQQRIGEAGRASVQRFDADTIVAQYANGYKALIARTSTHG
jgi:glycosyltransferase involved in cell wall biosynthesis